MSCIAVNIGETKKETIRLALKCPINGKDGKDQGGVFIDCDTDKEVSEIVLKRRGMYTMTVVCGWKDREKGSKGTKASGFDAKDALLLKRTTLLRAKDAIHTKQHVYTKHNDTIWRARPWTDLGTNDIIQDYYIAFQFCDE